MFKVANSGSKFLPPVPDEKLTMLGGDLGVPQEVISAAPILTGNRPSAEDILAEKHASTDMPEELLKKASAGMIVRDNTKCGELQIRRVNGNITNVVNLATLGDAQPSGTQILLG